MPDKEFKFEDIYKFATPRDLITSAASQATSSETQKKSLLDILMRALVDPNGNFHAYEIDDKNQENTSIKKKIADYFTGDKANEKANARTLLHGITKKEILDMGDADYWDNTKKDSSAKPPPGGPPKKQPPPDKVTNLIELVPSLSQKSNIEVSIFSTNSPYLSPSRKGTQQVEMFLNYMPSIMASRMVPYLEVELQLSKPNSLTSKNGSDIVPTTNTPSILRFLAGSGEVGNIPLTEADKALYQTRSPNSKESNLGTGEVAHSGMEMFLMPQTLTNMDNLGTTNRLVQPKPFVPFASVEDFSVQILNAGSGAMCHKKGTLKFKIHDKSRLSEISEFLRGPVGYKTSLIWTTYGWLAPRNGDDPIADHYSKFINDNMIVTDCWQVANTQFGFDATGQMNLTLELVGKGILSLQKTSIDAGAGVKDAQDKLKKAMEEIAQIRERLPSGASNSLGVEVRSEQILNAASVGNFPELKGDDKQINEILTNLKNSLLKSGRISKEEGDALEKNLRIVKDYKSNIEASASASVIQNLTSACQGFDPFLADEKRAAGDDPYFNPDLVAEVKKFNGSAEKIRKNEKPPPKGGSVLIADPGAEVISFGKLFASIVVPAILSQNTCDELQVIFYALNDQCGPVSGASVAEFPIDVRWLSYAYRDLLKTGASGGSITIEEFVKLVVNSQFCDNRAIGYGMNSAYEPFNPDDKESKKIEEKAYESFMTDWLSKYGTLQRPVIEMLVEMGQTGTSEKNDIYSSLQVSQLSNYIEKTTDLPPIGPNRARIIKRIHIYDKQSNPYKLLTQVMSNGEGSFSVGQVNVAKVKARVKALRDAKTSDEAIVKQIESEGAKLVDRPSGVEIQIGPEANKVKVRDYVKHLAPNIVIGTNGTLVKTAQLASKTDGLMAAANIINSNKNSGGNKGATNSATPINGLEGPNGLPLRMLPAALNMTTLGCPIAQLYQQYFVDFGTGTTLDNLYTCTQISHTIGQGKFDTTWTFVYSDGYGKFGGAGTVSQVATGELQKLIQESKPKK